MSVEAVDPVGAPHPMTRAVDQIAAALDLAVGSDATFLSGAAQRDAMVELTRVIDRAEALRARVMHAAGTPGGATEADGARTSGAWLASKTRTGFGSARRAEKLGAAVCERWRRVGAALDQGRMRVEQARVIIRALDALPSEVDPEILCLAEEHLVELADRFDPRRLEVLGEKILEIVAPETYDDQERKALERAQRRANAATRLTFSRRGDGSTDVKARVPEHVAARLKTMLEAWTSPRHDTTPGAVFDQRDPATGVRLTPERLFGEAFAAFLEAADPARMPSHGGAATRIVVTIDLEALTTGLGVATMLDGEQATRLTASEARRLACQAQIIPAVLGSKSVPLDMGRASRFFKDWQRLAKMLTHPVCAADGCTVPSQWCEAHHCRDPWATGGRSDLDDLQFLCPWHHQRAHDPAFHTEQRPDGSVSYRRRRSTDGGG